MIATMLAFLAAALAAGGLALAVPAEAIKLPWTHSRSQQGGRTAPRTRLGTAAVRALASLGRGLAPAARVAAPRELEARIAAAGLAGPSRGALPRLDARELMAVKVAATVLGAAGGLVLGATAPGRLGVALAVAGPVGGFLAPDLWLARRARDRARRVRQELPGMLDLLRVTIEAGLSLPAALTAVGERTRGELGAEWRVVGGEVALGLPLASSLDAMARRMPVPEITAMLGALERTIRHGAPLANALAAQARDARAARRRRIREEAARAGPKIQLVVALLLVPSVLLMVAAALAGALLEGGGLPIG